MQLVHEAIVSKTNIYGSFINIIYSMFEYYMVLNKLITLFWWCMFLLILKFSGAWLIVQEWYKYCSKISERW